jgi:hypothetical protein
MQAVVMTHWNSALGVSHADQAELNPEGNAAKTGLVSVVSRCRPQIYIKAVA